MRVLSEQTGGLTSGPMIPACETLNEEFASSEHAKLGGLRNRSSQGLA